MGGAAVHAPELEVVLRVATAGRYAHSIWQIVRLQHADAQKSTNYQYSSVPLLSWSART